MLVLSLRCQQCFHPTSVDHLSAWKIINNVISTIRNYYKGVDTFNCLEPNNCKTVHFIQAVTILPLCNPVTGDVFFHLVPGVFFQRGNTFLKQAIQKRTCISSRDFYHKFNSIHRENRDECKRKGLSIPWDDADVIEGVRGAGSV